MDGWHFHENLQQVGPTWSETTSNRLKQGCKAKDSPYSCFCHLPLAADEDSRLNLERLGSLGSTSLLQFLPELLGTLTEDNKAGEALPQQWEGAHGLHLQIPQISSPICQVFAEMQHYAQETNSCHSVSWDFGETCWAALPAAQHHLIKSPNEFCKTARQQNQGKEKFGLRGDRRQNKIAVLQNVNTCRKCRINSNGWFGKQ